MSRNTMPGMAMLCCLTAMTMLSCQEEALEEQEQPVQFSFAAGDVPEGGRLADINDARAIVISIKDAAGAEVLTMKKVDLYDMKGRFISAPVSLKPGNLSLTDFLVVDEDDNVLYVTPKEGSARGYLVEDPLPVSFQVVEDETTKVSVAVISAEDNNPELSGYASYSLEVVETFKTVVNAFVYNESTHEMEATTADIEIRNVDKLIYERTLDATTNNVLELLSEDFATRPFTITITKTGYESFQKRYNFLSELPNPLDVILKKDDPFKLLLTSTQEEGSINFAFVPSGAPDKLFFTRWHFGEANTDLWKMDIRDLDNPGDPVFVGDISGRFGEDPSGTLFMGDHYSTDNGENWHLIEGERPIYNFVEFKGSLYGAGDGGVYKETATNGWEVLPSFVRPRMIVYNNRLFTNNAARVTDNGTDFTQLPQDDVLSEGNQNLFVIEGRFLMFHNVGGQRILEWDGTDWDKSIYETHNIDRFKVSASKYMHYILYYNDNVLSVINVRDDCAEFDCTASKTINFYWPYEDYIPMVGYIGGDKYFVIAPDDKGRTYLYALDLTFLNEE